MSTSTFSSPSCVLSSLLTNFLSPPLRHTSHILHHGTNQTHSCVMPTHTSYYINTPLCSLSRLTMPVCLIMNATHCKIGGISRFYIVLSTQRMFSSLPERDISNIKVFLTYTVLRKSTQKSQQSYDGNSRNKLNDLYTCAPFLLTSVHLPQTHTNIQNGDRRYRNHSPF